MARTTLKIPLLGQWERESGRYQLFRHRLGYLRIKPAGAQWELTLARDLDGVHVGQPEQLATASSPDELVTAARPGGHLHQQLVSYANCALHTVRVNPNIPPETIERARKAVEVVMKRRVDEEQGSQRKNC